MGRMERKGHWLWSWGDQDWNFTYLVPGSENLRQPTPLPKPSFLPYKTQSLPINICLGSTETACLLSTRHQATPRPLGWLPVLMVEYLLASETFFVFCSHPAQVLPSFYSILQHSVSHQQNLPCSFSNCFLNTFPLLAPKETWLSAI